MQAPLVRSLSRSNLFIPGKVLEFPFVGEEFCTSFQRELAFGKIDADDFRLAACG